jgi:hypothetical protein
MRKQWSKRAGDEGAQGVLPEALGGQRHDGWEWGRLTSLDELVTWIPVEGEIVPEVLGLHDVVNEAQTMGLVALVPLGMTLISSVDLTPDMGSHLRKEHEFGYFRFGGSDIVMIFQDRNVVLDAELGTKYLQGQRIGRPGEHN